MLFETGCKIVFPCILNGHWLFDGLLDSSGKIENRLLNFCIVSQSDFFIEKSNNQIPWCKKSNAAIWNGTAVKILFVCQRKATLYSGDRGQT